MQLQEGETPKWFLRGPLIRPEERRFSVPASLIGVRLRPGVAFLLGGLATHTIVGRRLGLSETAAFHGLVSGETSLRTPARCIDVLQRFLISRLKDAAVHDVVAAAVGEVDRERGCIGVAEIAARCGVSPRHLNRLMRIWVGYGAKRYASVVRFQQTLQRMEDSPGRTAAALASETGYFDQAHLSVNTTRFAGATPGVLTSSAVADFSKTRCDDLP